MKMLLYIFLCLFHIVLTCQMTITGNNKISCCSMLDKKLRELETKVKSNEWKEKIEKLEERIKVKGEQIKETALKPAFSAFLKDNIQALNGRNILKFDDVRINLGSHYNPKTGKFTAPKSGLYQISYNLVAYQTPLRFKLNKNKEAFLYGYIGRDGSRTSPSTVLMDLKKGDKVNISARIPNSIIYRRNFTQYVNGGPWPSFFSGFLLQPM